MDIIAGNQKKNLKNEVLLMVKVSMLKLESWWLLSNCAVHGHGKLYYMISLLHISGSWAKGQDVTTCGEMQVPAPPPIGVLSCCISSYRNFEFCKAANFLNLDDMKKEILDSFEAIYKH